MKKKFKAERVMEIVRGLHQPSPESDVWCHKCLLVAEAQRLLSEIAYGKKVAI